MVNADPKNRRDCPPAEPSSFLTPPFITNLFKSCSRYLCQRHVSFVYKPYTKEPDFPCTRPFVGPSGCLQIVAVSHRIHAKSMPLTRGGSCKHRHTHPNVRRSPATFPLSPVSVVPPRERDGSRFQHAAEERATAGPSPHINRKGALCRENTTGWR